MHYHFPAKADLGAAVARRYWEDSAAVLEAISAENPDPARCLARYPGTFRISLEHGNRICLCSFMSAEYDDLPGPVETEVLAFADVNVAWLTKVRFAAGHSAGKSRQRARAIFAAVAGAQLMARSRADISVFDELIEGYRDLGLFWRPDSRIIDPLSISETDHDRTPQPARRPRRAPERPPGAGRL